MTSKETSRFLEVLVREAVSSQSNPLIGMVISDEDIEFKGLLCPSALIQVIYVSSVEKLNSFTDFSILITTNLFILSASVRHMIRESPSLSIFAPVQSEGQIQAMGKRLGLLFNAKVYFYQQKGKLNAWKCYD